MHRRSRQRGRLWITIQDPADEIGRQPGEMDQVADIVVGDVFTYRNLCGYRRSRPYIPTRSRPGIPIGSRPPLASIAWVDLMMSLRDEKVK